MNYMESKKKLDELRRKNEILFRMAISHLMDTGIRHFTEESVARTCAEIMKQDDSHSIMTNEFQCELVKTAAEIAKLDHIHVLTYIGREVYWDVGDNEISYQRAIGLLRRCVETIDEHHELCSDVLEDLYYAGFNNDEIESLGYGYLLDVEEEGE